MNMNVFYFLKIHTHPHTDSFKYIDFLFLATEKT